MDTTLSSIFGCLIIFVATTLGATIVYFIKSQLSSRLNRMICGFSAGVMIAASIFSLILPAIEHSASLKSFAFLPVCAGVILGGMFLHLTDFVCKKISLKKSPDCSVNSEKIKLTRFIIAFTVHNVPEGLAVGFALGNAISLGTTTSLIGAVMLAIGIAVQNIPEGLAVALPVYKYYKSKNKGFVYGMLSGIVEPVSAVIGLLLSAKIQTLLAWSLAFSAGAMLFVAVEDLIPEAKNENSHLGTWAFFVGFVVMMVLDVAFS